MHLTPNANPDPATTRPLQKPADPLHPAGDAVVPGTPCGCACESHGDDGVCEGTASTTAATFDGPLPVCGSCVDAAAADGQPA